MIVEFYKPSLPPHFAQLFDHLTRVQSAAQSVYRARMTGKQLELEQAINQLCFVVQEEYE